MNNKKEIEPWRITINELLDKIKDEILKRAGQGFTVEVSAEITKHETYQLKFPSLWDDLIKNKREFPWRLIKTITKKKYISAFQRRREDKVESVDWMISISKEVENQIPQGITIYKNPSSVLYDGRDFSFNIERRLEHYRHLEKKNFRCYGNQFVYDRYVYEVDGRKTDYIEGRRVYITVSDEYASRIFNEVCNSKYPFRNYLLKKHDQILKDIALKWSCHGYHPHCDGQIFIGFSGVRIRGVYEGDGVYDWDSISYEKFGMANLKTYEQLYGMAIALIDTKKKQDSEWTKASYSIRNNNDNTSVCIDVVLLPPETTKQPAIQLKEW